MISPAILGERRSDETLREIVGLIFEGHLSPGSRLPPERELAGLLGVSRSTLREAMNRLEARGYIERRSKSGSYVRTAIPRSLQEPIEEILEHDLSGLGELIEIRKVLELWAVRKVTAHPDKGFLAAMKQCLISMKANRGLRTSQQFERYREADLKFHQTLAEMTGNSIFIHLVHFLSHLISRSISLSKQLVPNDYGVENLKTHERIVQAIQSKNAARAEQAILDHFRLVENQIHFKRL